jgi:hypothetical protein
VQSLAKSPVLWVARAVWLAAAVIAGAGFGDALAVHSRSVQVVGTALLWIGWAAVAVALIIPAAVGLTVVRALAPIGTVAALVGMIDHGIETSEVIAAAITLVATVVFASAEFGNLMVQASAYGDERRFLLRAPAAFYAPTLVSWALLCAATLVGPLTLAARNWWVGVPVTAAAIGLGAFLLPRFHRLSRRWLVLVPAGVVVHDHVALAETVMFRAAVVSRVRLALADTQAADLTGPAGGHAIEVTVSESTTVVLAGTRSAPGGTALHALAVLVAPTRPGNVLRAAGEQSLPVG